MKVTRQQAEKNRERVLEVAGRVFREKGFDGVGVADLMKSAGLTHGGFYANFDSKEDLIADSSERSLAKLNQGWDKAAGGKNGDLLRAVVAAYLSTSHRDDPGNGCLIAALGSDVARKSPAVRHAVTEGIRPFIELLTRAAPGRTKVARRKRALAIYASLVGAMVLARAVDDPALSKRILEAVKASV